MKYGNKSNRHPVSSLPVILFTAIAMLVACTGRQSGEVEDLIDTDIVFTASFDQDGSGGAETRTYVDTNEEGAVRMHWTAEDAITVFFSTYGMQYIFQGETGARGGRFSKAPDTGSPDDFYAGFPISRFYAIYPYVETTEIDEGGVIHYTFPDTQEYATDSFGLGANPMVAVTADTNDRLLIFKNACAFLCLKIYGGAKVAQITLRGNGEEVLTGSAQITAVYGGVPQTVMTGEGKVLTLNCGGVETSADSQAPTSFWLAIPPTTFEGGFTVEVTDDKGTVTTQAGNKRVELRRNVITPMPAFEVKPQDPIPVIPDLPAVNSNLPVLYVYTPGYAPAETTTTDLTGTQGIDKVNWVTDSHAYLKAADGTVTDLGIASIRGRGNTTWEYVKKPYAFKLDKKASLLGMPKDKRWDLLANYLDRTRLRNDVAFELGRRLTGLDWTPHGEYVELVVNNVFLGNYYLCEHIKIAKDRVPITELKEGAEDITGGYLLECSTEMDLDDKTLPQSQWRHQFYTYPFNDPYPYKDGLHGGSNGTYKLPVMIKDPEDPVITTGMYNYIKGYINQIQSDIVGNTNNWMDRVDIDSFIDWMFVQEVVGNYEPFHPKSCYMHKDSGDGKLMMGPLWDFDYATFKENYATTPVYHYSIWYSYMRQNSDFVDRVKERWPAARAAFVDVYDNYVTARASQINASADSDWTRWGGSGRTVNKDESLDYWPAVDKLKANLLRRIEQMDGEVENNMPNW